MFQKSQAVTLGLGFSMTANSFIHSFMCTFKIFTEHILCARCFVSPRNQSVDKNRKYLLQSAYFLVRIQRNKPICGKQGNGCSGIVL